MSTSTAPEGRFVIIAEFDVEPGGLERFLALAREDASRSVAGEPGCHQFDVSVEQGEAARVVLYEVYEDEAAFEEHLQTSHLAAFRDGIEPLVTGRRIRRLTRVHG